MGSRTLLFAIALVSAASFGCQSSGGGGGGTFSAPKVGNPFAGGTVEVGKLPATVEAFVAWRDTVAQEPEGGMAVFVVAQAVYAKDKALGLKFLAVAVDQYHLVAGNDGVKGKQLSPIRQRECKDRIGRKPYAARAYFADTSPENGYTLPADGLEIKYTRVEDAGENRSKVFVDCTGADNPRPIVLQRNNRGIWKAWEFSSLQLGVKKPTKVVDDDL